MVYMYNFDKYMQLDLAINEIVRNTQAVAQQIIIISY